MITNRDFNTDTATVMVLGGGVAGMRAAIDLAEAGIKVKLVESTHGLGGRVAQIGFMFPTHDCVLCRGTSDHGYGCTRPSISPAFLDCNPHPNIQIMTSTQVLDATGEAGDYTISLRHFRVMWTRHAAPTAAAARRSARLRNRAALKRG